MPHINNLTMPEEDFMRNWMQDQYSNFRNKIKSYTETNQRRSIKVFSYKFPDFTGYWTYFDNSFLYEL